MKKTAINLGILGLGSRSTLFYIEQLNKLYNLKFGGFSTCPFVLLNADFNTINQNLPANFSVLEKQLTPYLIALQQLGANSIVIPNITLHETFDKLNFGVKCIHPLTATIQKLKEKGIKKVALFGSLYSMEADYLHNYFNAQKISVLQPQNDEKLFLDHLRKLIYNHEETEKYLIKYRKLLEKYSKDIAVVIACTELSIPNLDENKNIFDMAQIQIQEALNPLN